MSNTNAVLNMDEPAPQPLTPFEKQPQIAQDVKALENNQAERDYAAYDVFQKKLDVLRVDLAEIDFEVGQNERAQKPSKAVAERLAKRREKKLAEIAALRADWDLRKRVHPGDMSSAISEFEASPAVHKTYVPAVINVEVMEGATLRDMCDGLRAEKARLLEARAIVIKAPRTADEVEAEARRLIASHKAKLNQTISAVRHVTYHDRLRKFQRRDAAFPAVRIPNGSGSISTVTDAAALLFALVPDAEERFVDLALENHQESLALSLSDRVQRLAEIDAGILQCEYACEHFHRLCMAEGQNPGQRIGGSVLAVLGIVEA